MSFFIVGRNYRFNISLTVTLSRILLLVRLLSPVRPAAKVLPLSSNGVFFHDLHIRLFLIYITNMADFWCENYFHVFSGSNFGDFAAGKF